MNTCDNCDRHEATTSPRTSWRGWTVILKILLGTSATGRPVRVPLDLLFHFGITIGASGSGKTMAVTIPIPQFIRERRPFGVIDAKGKLFDRALYLVHTYGDEDIWERVVLIDFGNTEVISPYNILKPIGDDFDFSFSVELKR